MSLLLCLCTLAGFCAVGVFVLKVIGKIFFWIIGVISTLMIAALVGGVVVILFSLLGLGAALLIARAA